MGTREKTLLMVAAMVALQSAYPVESLASAPQASEASAKQAGEGRWVPSVSIISGVTIQKMRGTVDSVLFEDMLPPPVPLRGFFAGDDRAVSPFVGATIELMTPAFDIPTRPRLFINGEILPTFAADRDVALERDPDCARGPEPDDICARDEDGTRIRPFGEDSLNGLGSRTAAEIDTLVFGANLGAAFPLQFRKRQLRIKPFVGWINYKVNATGFVVDGACDPVTVCTDYTPRNRPTVPGFLRETILEVSDSKSFNGIGPGLEVEMDTGRFGQLGVSLFIGGSAYAILGDRSFAFGTTETYDDQLGNDTAAAAFTVEVDPWMFRADVGIRFNWLGPER